MFVEEGEEASVGVFGRCESYWSDLALGWVVSFAMENKSGTRPAGPT